MTKMTTPISRMMSCTFGTIILENGGAGSAKIWEVGERGVSEVCRKCVRKCVGSVSEVCREGDDIPKLSGS